MEETIKVWIKYEDFQKYLSSGEPPLIYYKTLPPKWPSSNNLVEMNVKIETLKIWDANKFSANSTNKKLLFD